MAALNHMVVLADVGEVIGILMALIVPLLYAVKQIADATKQNKEAMGPQQPAATQPAGPRPADPPVARQAAAGQQADPLRNQVEEFLRRAGRGPQGERARPARRDVEILVDEPAPPRAPSDPLHRAESRSGATTNQADATMRPAQTDPPQPPPRRSVIPRKRITLAERSNERAAARASRVTEHSAHLGERIIKDDRQFDVDLKARFDHAVGTLAAREVPAAEQVPIDTPAGRIAAVLASPEGVRQAIILNEILTPPSHRW